MTQLLEGLSEIITESGWLAPVLALFAGTSIGFVQKLSSSEKYSKASIILKIVMGTLILLIGFYMFYLGF